MTSTEPAGVMMTLAGLAYASPAKIADYLAHDSLTAGDWSIAWIADDVAVPVNFAYIAKSASTGAYAVAIRGTYPNPFSPAYWDDADQDNPLGGLTDWPYGTSAGAKLSTGTWTGFSNLIALQGAGTSFADAVAAIPAQAEVFVTGHSLGGTLAPVVALWMTTLATPRTPTVYTFAGMTPGNAAFAEPFAAAPLAGRVYRYFNTLDTVAYGWDAVTKTMDFYQPAPQGGLLVKAALLGMAVELVPYGYTAVGSPVPLPGTVQPPTIPCDIVAYVLETLHQHMPDTYLGLLGAPPLPFTIGFGAVVMPREHPTVEAVVANRVPVYYLD